MGDLSTKQDFVPRRVSALSTPRRGSASESPPSLNFNFGVVPMCSPDGVVGPFHQGLFLASLPPLGEDALHREVLFGGRLRHGNGRLCSRTRGSGETQGDIGKRTQQHAIRQSDNPVSFGSFDRISAEHQNNFTINPLP